MVAVKLRLQLCGVRIKQGFIGEPIRFVRKARGAVHKRRFFGNGFAPLKFLGIVNIEIILYLRIYFYIPGVQRAKLFYQLILNARCYAALYRAERFPLFAAALAAYIHQQRARRPVGIYQRHVRAEARHRPVKRPIVFKPLRGIILHRLIAARPLSCARRHWRPPPSLS